MRPRHYRAWVRLLCAVALGLGISGTAAAVSGPSLQTRPVIAQVQGAVHDMVPASARAPLAVAHIVHRHAPTTVGVALLAGGVLVGGLVVSTLRRRRSTVGGGRRTSTASARAPPVAVGI